MSLTVLFPHRIRNPALDSLTQDYLKLASRFVRLSLQIAPFVNSKGAISATVTTAVERSQTFLLSERGKTVDTSWFVDALRNSLRSPHGSTFLVGDAYGYPPAVEAKASGLISLTPLTLPHEFALVILLEQLWRASAILNHHPYHK